MNHDTKYGIQKDLCKKSFAGTYTRTGAKLTLQGNPEVRLIIGTRRNTNPHKAKHFLLLFEGRNKPAIYFSSLYPTTDPNTFGMEYEGERYELLLDSDKAEILLLNQSEQAA
jgi:hypothetical protein